MPRCSAIKPNGERCRVSVEPGVEYCWAHDPENAAQRRRITSKAGKSRPDRELRELKNEVRGVIAGVLSGELERGAGAVALQGFNTLLKAAEQERKNKETEDLETRIEALERTQQKGARKWGT